MRVTIIDPVRESVQYREIHPPSKGALANIVGGQFKLAMQLVRGDLLYVNPYDTSSKGFSVRGRSFSGTGLVMGRLDEQGRYSASRVPVWEISAVVQFPANEESAAPNSKNTNSSRIIDSMDSGDL